MWTVAGENLAYAVKAMLSLDYKNDGFPTDTIYFSSKHGVLAMSSSVLVRISMPGDGTLKPTQVETKALKLLKIPARYTGTVKISVDGKKLVFTGENWEQSIPTGSESNVQIETIQHMLSYLDCEEATGTTFLSASILKQMAKVLPTSKEHVCVRMRQLATKFASLFLMEWHVNGMECMALIAPMRASAYSAAAYAPAEEV